jgi:SAM-dependent methyltransferase
VDSVAAFRPVAKRTLRYFRKLLYDGQGRWCPVCEKGSRRFAPYSVWGGKSREEAQCVHCGSLERHRFLWLYLREKTDLFDGRPKKMLHVAPEACLESKFRSTLGEGNYITADLHDPRAMVKMDVTDIEFPEDFFDVIYCSHVLEHVMDDRRAMREFRRVLKPGGWAILLVPLTVETTFEDAGITDPADRLRVFGQADHVRRYGMDYVDRLRESGFKVQITGEDDLVGPEEVCRIGLLAGQPIFHCT